MRILVVGGTGMLGAPVVRALQAAGFSPRVLSRDVARARQIFADPQIEVVAGDVADQASLERALAGCAGVHINLKGGPRPQDYLRVEGEGVRTIATAARAAGVERITYLSAYTVGGPGGDASPEGAGKTAAEAALKASGVPWTSFRASWFFESLPLFIQGGRALLIGAQPHALNWLAAADYGALVSRAFKKPEAANQALYLYGPEALTMGAALERYRAALHPEAKLTRISPTLLRMAGTAFFNPTLKDLGSLMAHYNRFGQHGDASLANSLLGAPTTTLDQWIDSQRRARSV